MRAVDRPAKITITMSPFPAWMWDVCQPNGLLVKRFKNDVTLHNWLVRNKYEVA